MRLVVAVYTDAKDNQVVWYHALVDAEEVSAQVFYFKNTVPATIGLHLIGTNIFKIKVEVPE